MPKASIHERRNVAIWCNGELHDLRLAIKDVESERTGILVVDSPREGDEIGRFRLLIRDEQRGDARVTLSPELAPLTLTEAPVRRESFARGVGGGRRQG